MVALLALATLLTGELRPYRVANVYAEKTGFVSRLAAARGDTVKEGQVLAEVAVDGQPLLEIRAPFAGVVMECYAQTGVRVGPGARRHETQVFDIAEVARLKLVLAVPRAAPEGTRVEFRVKGRRCAGTLERVAKRAGVLIAEVAVENADGALEPGAAAEVEWPG